MVNCSDPEKKRKLCKNLTIWDEKWSELRNTYFDTEPRKWPGAMLPPTNKV